MEYTKIYYIDQTWEATARPFGLQVSMSDGHHTGKLLERIIMLRLMVFTERSDNHGLSDNQFGFRKERSTLGVIRSGTKIVTSKEATAQLPRQVPIKEQYQPVFRVSVGTE